MKNSTVETNTLKCPICGSENNAYVSISAPSGHGSLKVSGKGSSSIYACAECGVLYTTPRNKEEL